MTTHASEAMTKPAIIAASGLHFLTMAVRGTLNAMTVTASNAASVSNDAIFRTSRAKNGSVRYICQNMIQNVEKMTRKSMNRALLKTRSMSEKTFEKEVFVAAAGAAPSWCCGSLKNRSVPATFRSDIADEAIRTYWIPKLWRTDVARKGAIAAPTFTS